MTTPLANLSPVPLYTTHLIWKSRGGKAGFKIQIIILALFVPKKLQINPRKKILKQIFTQEFPKLIFRITRRLIKNLN